MKREVKELELEVNKFKKQTKVQPPQDNHSNMVKKLEKGRTAPKIASQQHPVDKKVEYVRSQYLNTRRPLSHPEILILECEPFFPQET